MVFEPKGREAQWVSIMRVLEARLLTADPTQLISWAEFEKECGFDVRATRAAVYKAAREMLEKHCRTVKSVRGEGYRLDVPSERLNMVRDQEKRGMHHYVVAEELARNVPTEMLTAEQAKALDLRRRSLMNINNALARHETDIKANRTYVERVDQRLTSVVDRLRHLGVLVDEPENAIVQGEVVREET